MALVQVIEQFMAWLGRTLGWQGSETPVKRPPQADNTQVLSNSIPPVSQNPIVSKSPVDTLYSVAYANLGKHLTLNESVNPERGCAESVSWVLKNAGYPIPQGGIPSVAGITAWLLENGFTESPTSSPGYVVTGRSPTDAHVGICGKTYIMSNTSYTDASKALYKGQFLANYSIPNWYKTFPQTRFYVPPVVV